MLPPRASISPTSTASTFRAFAAKDARSSACHASMSGGSGSMIGTLVGALLMGMINNALVLAGLSSAEQTIVSGGIIILAVALSNVANKKKA